MNTPGFSWGRDDFKRELKRSSFAPGAIFLDSEARQDLEVFYAFCRAVDDSADDFSAAEGRNYLIAWKRALAKKPGASAPLLVRELWSLSQRRQIPLSLLRALVAAAASDLRPRVSFKTRKELFKYCHGVAGVVGQACLPIFGINLRQGAAYAETLGLAFQLINIVRDVREDAALKRNYLAQDDLKKLGSPQAVVRAYATLAQGLLIRSDTLATVLPAQGLRPSRLMRALYGELLETMVADELQVFEKRYRLSAPKKAWIILKALLP